MTVTSVLDTQTIVTSSDIEVAQTVTEIAAEEAEQEKLDFLNILLTQLAVQNPLDPMDTDEFTAQLTRYSQLEQQIDTNESLLIMTDILNDTNAASSFSYIGQEVELGTNVTVTQNGEATFSYVIEGTPDDSYITVTDEDGEVLFEGEGSTTSGAHTYTLSGFSEDEQLLVYVNAQDSDGTTYDTEVTSHVTVDGVWTGDDGTTYLTAGEISFAISDVLRVATATDTNTVDSDDVDDS